MKSFIIKLAIFAFLIALFPVSKIALTPYSLGDSIYHSKVEYFKNHKEDYNAVFFGSSHIYRQVNSTLLASLLEQKGLEFKSYNFGTPGTYNPEGYFLYDKFIEKLDSGTLEYAVLELQVLNSVSDENYRTTKGSYWNTLEYYRYTNEYIEHSNYSEEKKNNLYANNKKSHLFRLFDLFILKNYLTRKKQEALNNGYYSFEKEVIGNPQLEERRRVFLSDTTVLGERIKAAQIDPKKISESYFNSIHFEKLQSLTEKSLQKGVKLFFIITPRMIEEEYKELVPLINSLPDEKTIELYQYDQYPKLYSSAFSFDVGHLNNTGADYFTTLLAKELSKKLMNKPLEKQ